MALREVGPADDVLGRLAARQVHTGELSRDEAASMALLLLVAGHETTANMIGLGTERTGLPWLQLDAFFHQPNWTPLPTPEFRGIVQEAVARESWVIDGDYSRMLGDLVVARADTVVWLDLPRHVVMRQLVLRTLRRIATREELWNGNRERWRNFLSLDEEQSVIVWAWNRHSRNRTRYQELQDRVTHRRIGRLSLRGCCTRRRGHTAAVIGRWAFEGPRQFRRESPPGARRSLT